MGKIEYIGKCLLIHEGAEKTLVIGDLHLGYEESMRNAGYAIVNNAYEETLNDLDTIFNEIERRKEGKIKRVVLLGDLKHEFGRILRDEWKNIGEIVDYLEEKVGKEGEVVIVKGNHDVIIESITIRKKVFVMDYFIWEQYAFLHGNSAFSEIENRNVRYWIIGHAHPSIILKEARGVKAEKYKCFLIGKYKDKKVIILPSFFPLIEGTDARSGDLGLAWNFDILGFEVKVVGENLNVLDFGKLSKIE